MHPRAVSAVAVLLVVVLYSTFLVAGPAAAVTVSTNDGMTLTLNSNGSWGSLTVDGNTVPQLGGVTGGFIVAPMEGVNFPYQRNTFYPGTAITGTATQDGSNVNFTGTGDNLTFNITLTGGQPYIKVDGTVTGPGTDRAFMLYFRIPVDANGWAWADDVNTARTIVNGASNWYSSLCIVNQTRHPWITDNPFGTITKTAAPAMGLSLSPLFYPPTAYSIQYNSQGGFWMEFELGTTPKTTKHPNTADFHFTLYKHDPAWGNRSAVTRYHSFFPAWFTPQAGTRGGSWMYDNANRPVPPETPADYGIVWLETSMWDDQYCIDNNIINCKYVEPWCEHCTFLTQADAETAALSGDNSWYEPGKGWGVAEAAQMIILSGARNRTGTYIGWDETSYWTDGGNMFRAICNPDLEIPNFRNYNNPLPTHNRGTGAEYWEFYREWSVAPGPGDFYSGFYHDSVGGWWAGWEVVHNFAPEHWPYYDYSPGIYFGTVGGTSGVPTMWAPMSNIEFMKYTYEQMSAVNRPVMANSSSDFVLFEAAPWLDMIGAGESYSANLHNISLVRAIAGHKPSSFYSGSWTDAAMQDSLLMGIYPGCGSDNTYKTYRTQYLKYIPVLNQLDAAGWEAITAGRCSNANMLLERYGPDAANTLYLVLRAKVAGSTTITVSNADLGWSPYPPVAVTELLNGGAVTTSYDGSGNLVITSDSLALSTDRVYKISRTDAPPVANFSGNPTSGAPPLTVAFTDTSSSAPTSWSWTFGDGGTSTAQNPSHVYASIASYTVSLTVTNAYGSDGETKTNYIVVATVPPTFVAAGTIASGAGAITPPLPAGLLTNDILLLFLETCNQAITIASPNGGTWAEVTGSPVTYGTAGSTTATRLTVFWSRYNGTQGNPTTSDSGNHNFGRIIAIRGATTVGNPWDVTATGTEATVDTSGSIPGATTTMPNTLVVTALSTSLPDTNNATNYSAWTNANLTGLTERTDNARNAGNGGGFGTATGVKAAAGAYGNTGVTCATASTKAMLSIAIKP